MKDEAIIFHFRPEGEVDDAFATARMERQHARRAVAHVDSPTVRPDCRGFQVSLPGGDGPARKYDNAGEKHQSHHEGRRYA